MTFSGTHSMIKMCYLIDMIVAFLMLVLSVCMMLVSFIVLKFSITFTISGEFREIEVLKAIGIKSTNIRGFYMAKIFLFGDSRGDRGIYMQYTVFKYDARVGKP